VVALPAGGSLRILVALAKHFVVKPVRFVLLFRGIGSTAQVVMYQHELYTCGTTDNLGPPACAFISIEFGLCACSSARQLEV
jgi:hypothetical protein